MTCKHYDSENGWCKLHSSWLYPMPIIRYCEKTCDDYKEDPTKQPQKGELQ